MKKLLIAVLLMAGISQAGIIGGLPPLVPDYTPCPSVTTIYSAPTDTIAQVDVLVNGVVFEQATVIPSILNTGWLEFTATADYSFRIYDQGSTVVGSSYWDSYAPLRIHCKEYVVFGKEQTVVPEPAAMGLMVLTAGSALFIRRMFLI